MSVFTCFLNPNPGACVMRPVWKGQVTFGLVNVPTSMYSAEQRDELHLHLIDSRNNARVRYERVNESTGEEVPWEDIVKGYKTDEGELVLLTREELEQAAVEMTKSIEITQFVDPQEISVVHFDKPYYLVPQAGAEKGYILLREAMRESQRVGVAKIVIRTKQYLAAMMVDGDALVLNLLRFEQELRKPEQFDFPGHDLRKVNVNKREIELAKQLLEGMTEEWDPSKYHDEYRDAVMQTIERKLKSGGKHTPAPVEGEPDEAPVSINFMELLKKSVEEKKGRKIARKPVKNAAKTPKKKKKAS